MTSALDVFGPKLPGPEAKANWLGRYLAVEHKFDKELFGVLKDAEKGIVKELGKVEDRENIGSRVRTLQYKLARKTIRDYVNDLFGPKFGRMLRGYQSEAAEEAINASLYDQRGLMSLLFKNPTDRQNYADSLRQTARRNVESAMTRILQTKIPLSQRVYKTKALANGLVDNVINNGLARGDSAADIARNVRGLISPETPGGISYAAKRLGRTEINNAFHAQAILDTQEKPWIAQMQWNLSKRHESDPGDLCESYALTEKFDKERVPVKPHPNCRCFVTPVLPDYDLFENDLVQGHYDSYIDQVLAGGVYHTGEPEKNVIELWKRPVETQKQREIRQFGREISDIESAPSPQAVAFALREKYPNVGFKIGWNDKNTTLQAAKEYARGLDEMLQKYPNQLLDEVIIGEGPDWEYARTLTMPSNGHSLIIFNKRFARDEKMTIQHMKDDVDTFYHMKGAEKRPYYYMAIHEFGHVLDASAKMAPSENALDILRREFLGKHDEIPQTKVGEFMWWLETFLDGYARDHGSGWANINAPETVAEAFADFELNGDKGLPTSEPLHMLLLLLTKHLK